jgi:hypothetical protein
MEFPIVIAGRRFVTLTEFARAILAEAEAGLQPSTWVAGAASSGVLDAPRATGLAAALLASKETAHVAEGARLAAALGGAELADRVALHLTFADLGLLLTPDPGSPGASLEETLASAWAAMVQLSDAETRARALKALRNACATDQEVAVLAAHGSPDEIRQWLPGILADGLPGPRSRPLVQALTRGGSAAGAIAGILLASSRGAPIDVILSDLLSGTRPE